MASKKKSTKEFDAQSWLFREFLEKMKQNNTKSLLVYTKDRSGNTRKFEWCMPDEMNKKTIDFISS